MNKIIIVIFAVAILITVGVFTGVLPGLSLLDKGTTTESFNRGGMIGNSGYELLDKKGYIISYKEDGHSMTITCRGKVNVESWATLSGMSKYRYQVYLKKDSWSNYETMSVPGKTSAYLSRPNPGEMGVGTIAIGGHIFAKTYDFDIMGNDYSNGAIRVEFWGYIDLNLFNPFDDGHQWRKLSSDEAYLYSGVGGLYLPTGIEDGIERPYNTFEIGQTVDIRVETATGGVSEKPWRVTLNEPYSGGITDPGTGGGIVKELSYANDVTNGHFQFMVTADMAKKSMDSPYPYTVRIWNELLPLGTLYVDFIDFITKAPSEATLTGVIQSIIEETVTVQITASVNPSTQAPIDYFRVSVIYGTNDVLLPSDPLSGNWLISTRNIPAPDGTATISFIPTRESYVSVHVKTFDEEGRASIRTKVWTMWIYAVDEVPDDVIDDETGEDDYAGGHTDPFIPWDPSGFWEKQISDYLPLIIAIAVFIVMLIIGLFAPLPYGIYGKIMVIALGAVLAVLIYYFV